MQKSRPKPYWRILLDGGRFYASGEELSVAVAKAQNYGIPVGLQKAASSPFGRFWQPWKSSLINESQASQPE